MIQAVTFWSFDWKSPFQPFSPVTFSPSQKGRWIATFRLSTILSSPQTLKLNHQKTAPHLLQFLLKHQPQFALFQQNGPPQKWRETMWTEPGSYLSSNPTHFSHESQKSWESPRSCTIQVITTIVQRKTDPSWLLPSKHRSDPSPTKEVVGQSRPRPQQNGLWFFVKGSMRFKKCWLVDDRMLKKKKS